MTDSQSEHAARAYGSPREESLAQKRNVIPLKSSGCRQWPHRRPFGGVRSSIGCETETCLPREAGRSPPERVCQWEREGGPAGRSLARGREGRSHCCCGERQPHERGGGSCESSGAAVSSSPLLGRSVRVRARTYVIWFRTPEPITTFISQAIETKSGVLLPPFAGGESPSFAMAAPLAQRATCATLS